MEEDKARAESCLEIHYLLRIVLSRHLRHQKEDFQSMHYFSFMERDLEYYKAAVPGSIYIDSRYNAAPESFTQFIRSFFMGVGGQLG
jgi:hypothetical protein